MTKLLNLMAKVKLIGEHLARGVRQLRAFTAPRKGTLKPQISIRLWSNPDLIFLILTRQVVTGPPPERKKEKINGRNPLSLRLFYCRIF